MKPIAIFRHFSIEGPGYFATFLDQHYIPWQLIKIDAGDIPPERIDDYSGLVFMGGPMSVNDDLPWIAPELALIRQAVAQDVPVLGHCLGGQLMSKALGGVITQGSTQEIGWGQVTVADHVSARDWFGAMTEFDAFHWHGETFSIPDGATCVVSSQHCAHQIFEMGPHLGMQCHVEMTADMVREWCAFNTEELSRLSGPAVQTEVEMQENLSERMAVLNVVATQLYTKWIAGLKK